MTTTFGQIVIGPPGSGKTTYCEAMSRFLKAIGREVVIVNIDPANENMPYKADIDVSELITKFAWRFGTWSVILGVFAWRRRWSFISSFWPFSRSTSLTSPFGFFRSWPVPVISVLWPGSLSPVSIPWPRPLLMMPFFWPRSFSASIFPWSTRRRWRTPSLLLWMFRFRIRIWIASHFVHLFKN